jgi:ribose transport system substrate-binding protein
MKKQKMNKRVWILVVIVNVLFLFSYRYFFFGGIDSSAGNQEKRVKIGACFMTMDSTYFEMLNNEISSVIEAYGDVLITRDPGMKQDKQNDQINELIYEGVVAIFITPVDWKGIEPSIKRAKEKGIKIIVVDSQVYNSELVDCSVTSDNFDAGAQIANYLMTQVSSSRIVLLQQSGVKSSMGRMNGFTNAITGYSKFKIVATKEYDGDAESALSAIEEVIQSGTQFDAVFATNDAGGFGTYAAIEKTGYSIPVNIMGVNGSPDGKDMIMKKQMMGTAAQFPTDMGKKAAESMYALLHNEECQKEIYIPVKLITKYTIDSYDTDKWQ